MLEFTKNIAKKAGEIVREGFEKREFKIERKREEVVTEVDWKSERIPYFAISIISLPSTPTSLNPCTDHALSACLYLS